MAENIMGMESMIWEEDLLSLLSHLFQYGPVLPLRRLRAGLS